MKNLRIVFFGTPHFAAVALSHLIEKQANLVAVVTKPDKPFGRHQKLKAPEVKVIAEHHQIPLYQPLKASTDEFASQLRELKPDLFVVVSFGEIFKENLLRLPRLGCINVHASLLPKYRGAAPIHRAVMAGDKESGVTIMAMAKELDAGEILSIGKTPIPEEMTTGELFEALAIQGAFELEKVLLQFQEGKVSRAVQDKSLVSYAPKIAPEETKIDWRRPSNEIHNLIRGLSPRPGAWCELDVKGVKKRLLLKKARQEPSLSGKPGEILSENGLIIACGEGSIRLLEIQLEGKNVLSGEEFLRGIPKKELTFTLN